MTHTKHQSAPRRVINRISAFLRGDDIFISYSHNDALNYAPVLATLLEEKKFQCYLDQYGSNVDNNLPPALIRRLKRSTVLVLIGTKSAAKSRAIKEEVEVFKTTGRPIIPINVDDAVDRTAWIEIVQGVPVSEDKGVAAESSTSDEIVLKIRDDDLIQENSQSVISAQPSPIVISRIVSSFKHTKRNARQRAMFVSALLLLLASFIAVTTSLKVSANARQEAEDALKAKANAEAAKATAEAAKATAEAAKTTAEAAKTTAEQLRDDAQNQASIAAGRADAEQARAERASAKATQQEKIARSRSLAITAARRVGKQPDQALKDSIDAYQTYATVEARNSLRDSLEQYPQITLLRRDHEDGIYSIASCYSGDVIVTGGYDHRVVFWDLGRKRRIQEFSDVFQTPVFGAACVSDGSICATADQEANIVTWNVSKTDTGFKVEKGKAFKSRAVHGTPNRVLAFISPQILIAAGNYGEVVLWDLSGPVPVPTSTPLIPEDEFAYGITLSPDGKTIAVGFARKIVLWSPDQPVNSAIPIPFPVENGSISRNRLASLSFSSDGRYLAVANMDKTVAVWDRRNLKDPMSTLPKSGNEVTFLKRQQTQLMLTSDSEGKIKFWDVDDRLRTTYEIFGRFPNPFLFEPGVSALKSLRSGSNLVVTGSPDGLVALWDMGKSQVLAKELSGTSNAKQVLFNKKGDELLTRSRAGVQHWKVSESDITLLGVVRSRQQPPAHSFTMTAKIIGTKVCLVDPLTSAEIGPCREVAPGADPKYVVSPNGARLAVKQGTSIALFKITDKVIEPDGKLDNGFEPTSFAFSNDSSLLIAGYQDDRAILWNVRSRSAVGSPFKNFTVEDLTYHKKPLVSVAISPDGKTIVGANESGIVSLWDVKSRVSWGSFKNYSVSVKSIAFNRNGTRLAIAADEGVTVFDLTDQRWLKQAEEIIAAN